MDTIPENTIVVTFSRAVMDNNLVEIANELTRRVGLELERDCEVLVGQNHRLEFYAVVQGASLHDSDPVAAVKAVGKDRDFYVDLIVTWEQVKRKLRETAGFEQADLKAKIKADPDGKRYLDVTAVISGPSAP